MNTRAQAANIVNQVVTQHQSLNKLLSKIPQTVKQFPLLQEICYGVLRWYYFLLPIADELLAKPPSKKHTDIYHLLLVGLYQLMFLDIPEYAIVSETVSAAAALEKPWAKAVLNKTLRRFIQERENLIKPIKENKAYFFSHPQWLVEKLNQAWPEQWEGVLTANNQRPPMTLRVNTTLISRDNYLKLLQEKNIKAKIVADLPEAILLETPVKIDNLPGFDQGLCYIQDAAGQWAPFILKLQPHLRILDACAAPGSKTSHILQLEPNLLKIVAVDKDPERMTRLKNNIDRLQLGHKPLQLVLSDASHTNQWWDGECFDRILLDAPCSATGVVRRHPDIKLLRRVEDIKQYADHQGHLLKTLWPLLASGGLLLYSTCSILPEENEGVVGHFIHQHNDAKAQPLPITVGKKLNYGHQILPGEGEMDGFYYALLKKQ